MLASITSDTANLCIPPHNVHHTYTKIEITSNILLPMHRRFLQLSILIVMLERVAVAVATQLRFNMHDALLLFMGGGISEDEIHIFECLYI